MRCWLWKRRQKWFKGYGNKAIDDETVAKTVEAKAVEVAFTNPVIASPMIEAVARVSVTVSSGSPSVG